jgi:hypothetical protein
MFLCITNEGIFIGNMEHVKSTHFFEFRDNFERTHFIVLVVKDISYIFWNLCTTISISVYQIHFRIYCVKILNTEVEK